MLSYREFLPFSFLVPEWMVHSSQSLHFDRFESVLYFPRTVRIRQSKCSFPLGTCTDLEGRYEGLLFMSADVQSADEASTGLLGSLLRGLNVCDN